MLRLIPVNVIKMSFLRRNTSDGLDQFVCLHISYGDLSQNVSSSTLTKITKMASCSLFHYFLLCSFALG